MADIQAIISKDIDFNNKKYVLINAKQYDKQSRFVLFTCYNNNEFVHIDRAACTAFVRYRKADDYGVFNRCTITDEGRVLTELTEQMLAASGLCCADLIIAKGRSVEFDTDGNFVGNTTPPNILSTMTFYVDVVETPIANSSIESTYDYNGFNQALEEIKSDYSDVIKLAKSYAVGGTGRRVGENTDNAKYYYEQTSNNASTSQKNASNAASSESNAKKYMDNALAYSQNAQTYMNNADTYMTNAAKYMDNAEEYMDNANDSKGKTEEYMNIAKSYMDNAESSKTTAESYRDEAEEYMNNAAASASNAADSEANAAASASNAADSEANATTYYQRIQSIVSGLETGFIPMGTISFSELAAVERTIGCVYNIRDDFTTNENFAEGSGMSYTAGTNVYVRSDGLFDCFGGSSPVTATVNEVKQYLNINQ